MKCQGGNLLGQNIFYLINALTGNGRDLDERGSFQKTAAEKILHILFNHFQPVLLDHVCFGQDNYAILDAAQFKGRAQCIE